MIENEINIGNKFKMRVNFNLIKKGGEDEKRQIWLTTTINKERARVYTGLRMFNVQWLLYVVWQKCKSEAFAKQLKSKPKNTVIIENSTHQNGEAALFWGMANQELEDCRAVIESEVEIKNPYAASKTVDTQKMIERNKINDIGIWSGVNCMGKILTVCKWCLDNGIEPAIDYELLRSKQIHLFGKLLTF